MKQYIKHHNVTEGVTPDHNSMRSMGRRQQQLVMLE